MQNENNPRTSFFDDDDLKLSFEFVKPEKSHFKHLNQPPLFKSILSRQLTNSDSTEKGLYVLHNRILALYENNVNKVPLWVLDLAHSRLDVVTATEEQNPSFSVTRNGNTFRFFSHDKKCIDSWATVLRGVCVLKTFHEEYKALKMIGKGSFAKVYLVESKATRKHFAVKAFTKEGVVISNKANAKPAMLNEIDIMRALDHEHVIKLYEVFETEKSIYLVMELIQGKSLQEMLKKGAFKEENAEIKIINTIRSILDALAYLASKGVMHRDLKPDNILLDKGEKVKIVDFGLATFVDVPEYIFKKCGTPGYIAPEVFKYDVKNPATAYSSQCDVFSIGCILHYMLFGSPFFEGSNASEILKCNRKFTADFAAIDKAKNELKDPASKISKDGLDLLLQLLEFDQRKRPHALHAMKHTFFTPIPTGIQKIPGFTEHTEVAPRSHTPSMISPIRIRTSHSGSPDKFSPLSTDKHRYTEKDSLYLDVGRPEMNGRVDTLAAGNTQNSLLFANRIAELAHNGNNASSNGSLSPFGKGSRSEYKRPSTKTFKGHSLMGANAGFLKAAIYRNMHRNDGEESKDDGSPGPTIKLGQIRSDKRHRYSEHITPASTQPSSEKLRSQSPGYYRHEPVSSDTSNFQIRIEQVQPNSANPVNISRSSQSTTRRYQPFVQKTGCGCCMDALKLI